MKILVINTGSSSLKYQLFDMSNEEVIAKGGCERIGIEGSFCKYKTDDYSTEVNSPLHTHKEAIELVLQLLQNKEHGVIKNINDIYAIGHRIVHGGKYSEPTKVDNEVLDYLKENIDLAPLHLPGHIAGIEACQKIAPNLPNVIVVDTAFHFTMPEKAYRYSLPKELCDKYLIRKYGFHGSSHRYVSEFLINKLGLKHSKIVTCHIGNGSSVSAVVDGKCVDTSMGFTPLAGVVMGTRTGDMDPAVLEYLMKKTGWNISETTQFINKKCGMLGVCGSSDARDVVSKIKSGDKNADLALELVAYTVTKYIGSYVAAMNGVDNIIFTAGLGENCPEVRERILNNLSYLGLKYDKELNMNTVRKDFAVLSTSDSKVGVYVIATNEELVIARDTLHVTKKR